MKLFRSILAALLAAALLFCGCARRHSISNVAQASDRLCSFLQDFAYSEKDEYDCVLQDILTVDGNSVYCLEAFWHTDTEGPYSLGLFYVAQDGTVTVAAED